ncbi:MULTISPECIES: polysaccharide biosynthesis/export family protein [Nostocales]|uniref:Sugar ABC transporter substrate-binding protein n=3 Tax=Nostocales TaxID=1161 RepID=A0A0C1MZG2_9CYAN|nr:polysaccharide biosynthesis/export family protein [Tolypothrix bouteillei]KAF3888781.1 sugar ABC transporter substrate-binding protein [Tolypothrix bouteillei VB521301]
MRIFSALSFIGLHVGVYLIAATVQPVAAQNIPTQELPPGSSTTPPRNILEEPRQIEPPTPPSGPEVDPSLSDGVSPQFTRYLLGPGDGVNVLIQRPSGKYRLGPGDGIAVSVQRFPDLSFQAIINPEGNIVVPLLGTVSLRGLTLEQAQEKIRVGLNRFVVDPIVALALTIQRPELSFTAQLNPEGNIIVPQVGTISLQGLTLDEAQEKIRLSSSRIYVDPVVSVSLAAQRPVQITISGEVTRPGIYSIASGLPRVGDALILAGGSSMTADLRQVQIRRRLVDGSVATQNVDLYTPLQNGGSVPNLRLQDGDAIVIPRREIAADDGYDRNLVSRSTLAVQQIRVRVLNYASGGIVTIPLPNGSNFLDALAGVNLDTANLRGIKLFRFDPERGRAIAQTLNARKALSGDSSQNVPLQDNDVIVIGRNLIGKITNAISLITRPFISINAFLDFFNDFGRD